MYFSAFDLGIGGGAILLGPVATPSAFVPCTGGWPLSLPCSSFSAASRQSLADGPHVSGPQRDDD
ncbi:hypothetical protein, partial [Hydrogenibacillus schlegelii]|uniref:hypothetical protein n=1 Tax=Hydrogenibacillus schlegelii TaxID=1484 RepID=UPI0034A06F8D